MINTALLTFNIIKGGFVIAHEVYHVMLYVTGLVSLWIVVVDFGKRLHLNTPQKITGIQKPDPAYKTGHQNLQCCHFAWN